MVGRLTNLSVEDILAVKQANDVVIRVQETNGSTKIDHFIAGVGPHPGLPLGEQGAA